MQGYKPRRLKFKAWNIKDKLLMRLNAIECNKGELFKKDHFILQFTGMFDKHEEEIYEMDILLIGIDKYLVTWSEDLNGWYVAPLHKQDQRRALLAQEASVMMRLRSYFEESD